MIIIDNRKRTWTVDHDTKTIILSWKDLATSKYKKLINGKMNPYELVMCNFKINKTYRIKHMIQSGYRVIYRHGDKDVLIIFNR